MSSPFQKGFIDKSPIDKKLVGKQNRLPEELKAKILAAPEKSPLGNHEFGHKETSSAEVKQPKFIKNPNFDKLTDKEKKEYQIKAKEANKVITYKGVKFDPEDGALFNMPNPNYKK